MKNSCFQVVFIFESSTPILRRKDEQCGKNHSFLFFPSDLRHPNILLLMAVCNSQDPSQQGLVLEPVERAFLGKLLHEENTIFSEDTVLDLCRDIACAMQFVHYRGYIHCYLGSSSVVLTENFKAKVRHFPSLYGLVANEYSSTG